MSEVEVKQEEIKKISLDLYLFFKKLDELCKEGVSEEVVREAFEIFIKEKQHEFRRPQRRILKTDDSVPMLSQEEINQIYENPVAEQEDNSELPPEVKQLAELLLKEGKFPRDYAIAGSMSFPERRPFFLKIYAYRVAYYCVKSLIWILCKIGIK